MADARYSPFQPSAFTDFLSHPRLPSDESLGYFQSSANRGLGRKRLVQIPGSYSEPLEDLVGKLVGSSFRYNAGKRNVFGCKRREKDQAD